MFKVSSELPSIDKQYLVYGVTRSASFFWVDEWQVSAFKGMPNREILLWAPINDELFVSLAKSKPKEKGRFLVRGLRGTEIDMWVTSWNGRDFHSYPRQIVQAFQPLPDPQDYL